MRWARLFAGFAAGEQPEGGQKIKRLDSQVDMSREMGCFADWIRSVDGEAQEVNSCVKPQMAKEGVRRRKWQVWGREDGWRKIW
jgi:hypothetical protein